MPVKQQEQKNHRESLLRLLSRSIPQNLKENEPIQAIPIFSKPGLLPFALLWRNGWKVQPKHPLYQFWKVPNLQRDEGKRPHPCFLPKV